jgi:hypothetical protein
MQTVATYDSAADTFTLVKGPWKDTFPNSDLPKVLDFYRRQRELFPVHAAYESDVTALEALVAELVTNS